MTLFMSFLLPGGIDPRLASFSLDVRGLDDRPPLLDLGFVERGKPLRRLLLARGDIEPKLREAGPQRRLSERLHHRAVELGDDVFWRPLWREKPEPSRHVESGHAALIGGRNFGNSRRALRREIR